MLRTEDDKDLYHRTTMPAIHTAAEYGETKLISHLISRGTDVNVKDLRGNTPLMHVIVTSEDVRSIEHLLDSNADVYVMNSRGLSALGMIVKHSEKWLTTFLPRAVPKRRHVEILYVFFQKIRHDYFADRESTVQKLRAAGCPLALVPFMRSATITKHFFEQHSMTRQRLGCATALHVAVLLRDLKNVKILVACGADANAADDEAQTPLFSHSLRLPDADETLEILKILLDNGASLYAMRSDGTTPMEYFLRHGTLRTRLAVLNSKASLLEKCEPDGHTALHFLLRNEKLRCVPRQEIRILLSRGLDVNERNNYGVSALTLAVAKGREKAAEYLMKNGAEADWLEIVENTSMLEIFSGVQCDKDEHDYYRRIVELILLQQGATVRDLTTRIGEGFSATLINRFFMEVIIAHLAIAEAAGKVMPDTVRRRLRPKFPFENHYDICKARIEEMKCLTVCDSVTLHRLLVASDEEIDARVRDGDFVAELRGLMSKKRFKNLYYFFVIRKRVEHSMQYAELRKRSGRAICELTGLDAHGVDENHYVVYKILGYLSRKDIFNVFEGRSVSCDNVPAGSRTRNVDARTVMRKYLRHC